MSVVCLLLIVYILNFLSSETSGLIGIKLDRMFFEWFYKSLCFLLIGNAQKKQGFERVLYVCLSSSLKPVGQLELMMVGMFIGWSSRKLMFFCCWLEIHFCTWKKQDAQRCQKVCCLFLIFFSETTGSIRINLGRNVHFNGTVKNFLSAMEFDLYLRIL